MKRVSSNGSLSSISSYKTTSSNISAVSTSSSFSCKSRSLRSSSRNKMKRIKGSLSKKLKKGQRLASSMIISKLGSKGRGDMLAIEEDSVIDEEIVLDFEDNIEDDLRSTPFHPYDAAISEEFDEDIIDIDKGQCVVNAQKVSVYSELVNKNQTPKMSCREVLISTDESSDLTPRTANASMDTSLAPLLGSEPKDSIEEEQMVIEFTPRSKAAVTRNQSSGSAFRFDDDTISLTSFQTVRTVERLIHNPTTGLIFLLLLQIETKEFEIIQVHLPSSGNSSFTIGDILNQIGIKATDSTLAQQRYRGLCRSSDGIEMSNLSASATDEDGECRIVPGEVLVPIPEQSNGMEVMRASQCVLNLSAVDNLFQRLNPISPVELSCDESLDANEELQSLSKPKTSSHETYSPVGIELKYSEDHSTEMSSDIEVKPLNASSNKKSISSHRHTNNVTESFDKNIVEVVMPDDNLPTIEDLIKYPVRTLRIYEQHTIRLVQKQISMNSQQDARFFARIIVKGSKIIIIFLVVRRILVGTRSTTSGISNMTTAGSTDTIGFVGFVEFVLFLSFLIWYQKNNNKMKKKVRRSYKPRRIELWG